MILMEEIPVEQIDAFWQAHYSYLMESGIITDQEDQDYFQSDEYRGVIRSHMLRDKDRHHLAYFREGDQRIGAVSYCTYQSEGGKCFILDYWIFPELRSRGRGEKCFTAFQEYTRRDGAKYYEINCDGRADRLRFWKRLGFADNGVDEYGDPLLIKRDYKIIQLGDCPALLENAARWFHEKWGVPEEAYRESMTESLVGTAPVPQWYLALEGETIIGGLGVIENDFHDRPDLTPNVCAVYTEPHRRCRGVAGALLHRVCTDMKARGLDTLYLVTDHNSFYERYGWEFLCMVQGDGEADMTRMYMHRA